MYELKNATALKGEIEIPGDKSISHRAVMFGSISKGTTRVQHFLNGADCLSTISCFRKMGIDIDQNGQEVIIHGNGLHGLSAPSEILDTGNSGTTTRLISGILSAQPFTCTLNGDASIQKRPMKRIITPLSMMGADIVSERGNDCAPLRITGAPLSGIHYDSPVASAQVKSAILLAGLYAEGETSVTEPSVSRDHTELMLKAFGADVATKDTTATIKSCSELYASDILVPGDISSAAYFLVAGSIMKQGEILIRNVGINPTRAGILTVLLSMGADIREVRRYNGTEPAADLLVRPASLRGVTVEGDVIPRLIDEIPVLAVAAAMAEGTTVIRDAAELKVKESDRIESVTKMLRHFGADITPTEDGMIIQGTGTLSYDGKGPIESYKDHRIAMSAAIAALAADTPVPIDDFSCVDISFPSFASLLEQLAK
ncbi:MAG: 3-phosphoshikimate 1-carboxyvinyltransferase [Lachnospiraceae bacterium]|nr:3-phosphoshikimate 1-carboxyvinyltransferase [Lachnospiraceae bacterium]